MRTKHPNPKCMCGCGENVSNSDWGWNKYIPGHNLKLNLSEDSEKLRREKISATMKEYLANNEAARRKRGDAWRGKNHTQETKDLLSQLRSGSGNGMFGRSHTDEAKEKISKAAKGKPLTNEHKRKLSESSKGKIITEEQCKQISATLKEYYKIHESLWKGRKHTNATKRKCRIANLGRFDGPLHPQWQGGISNEPYAFEWPEISKRIIQRDKECKNPTCAKTDFVLTAHHIDYDKKNNNENTNLITLCRSCNCKANFDREKHKVYYASMLSELLKKYTK